jgi:hypothetical protein
MVSAVPLAREIRDKVYWQLVKLRYFFREISTSYPVMEMECDVVRLFGGNGSAVRQIQPHMNERVNGEST